MSRSGYSHNLENWSLICWRGQVASAMRGKRGQSFFIDLLAALDAMPDKRLIANNLERPTGEVCALGALGRARGVNMQGLDPEEPAVVAGTFNIAEQLAQEVVYRNDEAGPWKETPEDRFVRMRAWVASHIIQQVAA